MTTAYVEGIQGLAPNTLLTFKEAMSYLRVSRSMLYRLMEMRQLTGHKVGSTWRFYQTDVKACVQGNALSSDENQTDLVVASCKEGGVAWQ